MLFSLAIKAFEHLALYQNLIVIKEFIKMKEKEMKRACFYFPAEIIALCDRDLELADVSSRNKFVEQAVKFYDAYLHKDNLSEVLTPAFESVVAARLDLTEHRLSSSLFKLTVELTMLMNLVVAGFNLDSSDIQKLRHRCIREVKELNGRIDLEQVIKYQKGEI